MVFIFGDHIAFIFPQEGRKNSEILLVGVPIWYASIFLCILPLFAETHDSVVKNPVKEIQETWILSLGQEDPLEKEMATHSSGFPGKAHGQRSLVGYNPWGRKRVRHDLSTKQQQFCLYISIAWQGFEFYGKTTFLEFEEKSQGNRCAKYPEQMGLEWNRRTEGSRNNAAMGKIIWRVWTFGKTVAYAFHSSVKAPGEKTKVPPKLIFKSQLCQRKQKVI